MWSGALARLALSERLHREAFRPTAAGWEPPVDVLETDEGLLIVVALPGVRPDEMEIVVGRRDLLVRGTRRWPGLRQPAVVHRLELPHGRFERSLPLPAGTFQLVGQAHEDGCLLLTLRRLD
jgi:HSP20 family molecular chaperone IbpA